MFDRSGAEEELMCCYLIRRTDENMLELAKK